MYTGKESKLKENFYKKFKNLKKFLKIKEFLTKY